MGMFKLNSSEIKLANFILYCANSGKKSVFPAKEGWVPHLTHYYPEPKEKYYRLILLKNETHNIAIIPVDETVETHHLKLMSPKTIKHYLEYAFSKKMNDVELFFLTNENMEEQLVQTLSHINHMAGVISLFPGKIKFSRGEFKNSRLEYRLSKLKPNPDYIPNVLPLGIQQLSDDIGRISFYHSILHLIGQSWLEGEQNISLIDVLHHYNPFYSCFNKKDKKEFLDAITKDLKQAFQKYYDGVVVLNMHQKNNKSHPIAMVEFLSKATSKKDISTWFKKQKQALEWLQNSHQQMLLNVLSLIED